MNRSRVITGIVLVALAAVLIAGFLAVLDRRFAEGGVYPHYASFRSDPLGTSALFESLEALNTVSVRRNTQHLNSIGGLDEDTALLLLGYPRSNFDDLRAPEDSAALAAVKEGARLVITINPGLVPEKFQPVLTDEEESWLDRREEARREREEAQADEGSDSRDDEEGENKSSEEVEEEKEFETRLSEVLGPRLTKKLGFTLESLEEFERPEGGWETEPVEEFSITELPTWYSQYRFRDLDKVWKPVATVEGEPVAIERKFGKGTVALTSDSFFVSNEALHLEPSPDFLIWLLGGKSNVVFDETIHGTQESGGAMKLIRRYRLHGIFIGLLLFVALWAWRTASPLAPGSEDLDRGLVASGGTVSGEDSGSGFVRLLRWSLPRTELLDRCIAEWKESGARTVTPENEKAVEVLASKHRKKPKEYGLVEAYRAVAETLRRR